MITPCQHSLRLLTGLVAVQMLGCMTLRTNQTESSYQIQSRPDMQPATAAIGRNDVAG